MAELIPDIRNTARAVIIQDEQILLLRKEGGGRGERFALPGGAQDPGETLQVALDRECREEIGTSVQIGELRHVAEFFKLRETVPPTRRHLLECLFLCRVPGDYSPRNGHRPDKHQVEVLWMPLERLGDIALFPQYLGDCILRLSDADMPFYLGCFEDHVTA